MSQRVTSMGLGVILALLLAEGGLRLIATPNAPDAGPLAGDDPELPVETVRWYEEGFAESHFSSAKARIIPGPDFKDTTVAVLLLGDSFIQAVQVEDSETVGFFIQDSIHARVVQYGWFGAAPGRYMLVADTLRALWTAEATVIVLNSADFGAEATTGPYRILLDSVSGRAAVAGQIHPTRGGRIHRAIEWGMEHSVLIGELARRTLQVVRVRTAPEALLGHAETARAARAVVVGLRQAFGPRVILLYLPTVGTDAGEVVDPVAGSFFAECARTRVRCVSALEEFQRARAAGVQFPRGFANGPPGRGHLNPFGHRLLASTVLRALRGEGEVLQ